MLLNEFASRNTATQKHADHTAESESANSIPSVSPSKTAADASQPIRNPRCRASCPKRKGDPKRVGTPFCEICGWGVGWLLSGKIYLSIEKENGIYEVDFDQHTVTLLVQRDKHKRRWAPTHHSSLER